MEAHLGGHVPTCPSELCVLCDRLPVFPETEGYITIWEGGREAVDTTIIEDDDA